MTTTHRGWRAVLGTVAATVRRWSAHLAATLLDSFAALTGFYYSKKYAAIARRMGLRPATGSAADPGLIIIQIDGLAHQHVLQALEQGRLPHIRRMLDREGFVLERWRCGLPSSTPACQAGIMFGENYDIPAFRWYDKQLGTSLMCKLPGVAALLQSRLSQGRRGILAGGASYVNLFDGDASESLFTLSDLQPRHLLSGVRALGFLALFLLNPWRGLHMLYLVAQEYTTDLLQRLGSRLRGRAGIPFIGIFPFVRVFSNVISREIETLGVLVDVYRGVPAIYATYFGFDELAHHFGVDSMAARQALRDIDQRAGQVNRLRRANLTRAYTLCLLSDHGLTPSEPFARRYGQSLGDYIGNQLGSSVVVIEHAGGEQQSLAQTRLLLAALRGMEKNMQPAATRVARRLRMLVQRRLSVGHVELPHWNLKRHSDIVVKSSGSLAHVYFNIATPHLDLSEVSAAFPGLPVRLLAHDGIWLVVGREAEQTLIMSQEGILTLDGAGAARIEGRNPLLRLSEPEEAAEQIRRIASFPSSGDLILFGSYDPKRGIVVCFENQWASHGGVGGPQDHPFIIFPAELEWDLACVHNSKDLYPFLAAQRKTEREQGRPSGRTE